MAYKQKLDEILDREMDRLEFLRLSALLFVGIVGISRMLDTLHSSSPKPASGGYGSGVYGGEDDIAMANHQAASGSSFSAK